MGSSLILVTAIVSHAWFTLSSPPPAVPLLIFFTLSSLLIVLGTMTPVLIGIIAVLISSSVVHLHETRLCSGALPLPVESISSWTFTVLEDSDLSGYLSPMTRVHLTGIEDSRGTFSTVSRTGILFCDEMLLQGRRGEASGKISKENGLVFLTAYTVQCEKETGFQVIRREVREYIGSLMERRTGELSGFLQLLFLSLPSVEGNRIMEQARNKGVSHLFVLSGFHLQFITGALAVLGNHGKRRFLIIGAAHLYVAVAGYSPSLTRALITVTVSSASPVRQRPLVLLFTLALHALVVPHHLFTYSAVLSYSAVTGILFVYPAIVSLLFPYLPRILYIPISLSCSAFSATSILAFLLFSSVHPEGILYTLLLSPLMLPLAVLTVIIMFFPLPPVYQLLSMSVSAVQRVFDLPDIDPPETFLPVLIAYAVMLTWFLLQWYCSRILQKRSLRRYELDVSLRFAFRDTPSAGESFTCNDQEVRPEFPPFTGYTQPDRGSYPQ